MNWEKKGLIFCPDGSFAWSKTHASVPTAIYIPELDIIRIFYSTRDNQNQSHISFLDVDPEDPTKILYIHNKPVLSKGEIGCFDDSGVMPSWLLLENNTIFLYYVGWNVRNTVPYSNALGLAISYDNGENFERKFNGAIMDRNKEEPYFVALTALVKGKYNYLTYYLSCTEYRFVLNKVEPRYHIKYALSENGYDFIRNGVVAIDYSTDQEAGIARPSVLYNGDVYQMWYCYRMFEGYRTNKDASYKIGYAESKDGIYWDRLDHKAGILLSEEGWDSEMIAYPFVIKVKEKIMMFYNGNGFGASGIGFATLLNNG